MRYHNITKDDMLNGDGLRVVLWVSGCDHCCKEAIIVLSAIILLHGILMADWFLMSRQKKNYLRN